MHSIVNTDQNFLCDRVLFFVLFYISKYFLSLLTHIEFILEEHMLVRKTQSKKRSATGISAVLPLDSSLTSIEWLPNMQIGENSSSSSTTTTPSIKQSLPTTTYIQEKIEPTEVEIPTTTVNDSVHVKPPYSYVTLIRQAILSAKMQRMTLNEIYQWIVDSYPYFRTAPPKWKVRAEYNKKELISYNKKFYYRIQFVTIYR